MKLTEQQRKRLRKIYLGLADDSEKDALLTEETKTLSERMAEEEVIRSTRDQEISDKMDAIINLVQTIPSKDELLQVGREVRTTKEIVKRAATDGIETSTDLQNAIVKGLRELKDVLVTSSSKSVIPEDWSGFFKDGPTMLAQIGSNTGKTSELIRNLKWNASQQLRDVNGSPINPSIAPFNITSQYTKVALSDYDGDGNVGTVTYYQGDQVRAVLSLTYDVDGNLTEVQRTQ